MSHLKKYKYLIFFFFLFVVILLLLSNKIPTYDKPLSTEEFEPESFNLINESESLVENFPDLPQYPNAEITQSKYYTEEGGEGYYLEFSTDDDIMDVVNWFKVKLEEDDWYLIYQTEETTNPDYYLIEYKKPDIQLDVSVVEQKDGSIRVIITHHFNMGEYGPPAKYE